MVAEGEIRAAIKKLGLQGQAVCLHSSLRSFGQVDGGASTVLEAFMAEGSTVLVPTFSDYFEAHASLDIRPDQNACVYGVGDLPRSVETIFSADCNEIDRAEMGAIPAEVVGRPQRQRGNHPLCSFSALGKEAARLVATQTPRDVFAPLRELCTLNGSILLIGVSIDTMTLLHLAEELAGRRPFISWANDSNGQVMGGVYGRMFKRLC